MINIGKRRECFFDNFLINEDLTTAERRINKPTRRDVIFTLDGREIGRCDIVAAENVEKISFSEILWRVMKKFLFCGENS